jgi:hypothetical protein
VPWICESVGLGDVEGVEPRQPRPRRPQFFDEDEDEGCGFAWCPSEELEVACGGAWDVDVGAGVLED